MTQDKVIKTVRALHGEMQAAHRARLKAMRDQHAAHTKALKDKHTATVKGLKAQHAPTVKDLTDQVHKLTAKLGGLTRRINASQKRERDLRAYVNKYQRELAALKGPGRA